MHCDGRGLALALACLVFASCSFTLQEKPPRAPPTRGTPIKCSTSPFLPIVDLVIGGALATAATSYALAGPCPPGTTECQSYRVANGLGVLLFTPPAAVYLLSSVVGFLRCRSCGALKDKERACRDGDDQACADLYSAPVPDAAP